MKHTSIKLDTPCEFVNITPVNPLISKCQIKVCYVSDEPNRNRSIITKEVATQMANSLPGSPIVGFYNEANKDFEEHNRVIDISNGEFKIKDTTRPYGFVDMNAKVWFQKFLDDGVNEREYLMTEGYIWTGQYPEAQRIIDKGNNQSMELSENYLDATWTKDENGKPQFFIINEAIVSKLCILGEDCEPCFEGSQIAKIEFSFDDSFKDQLFSMMNELKEYLKEGGAKEVFIRYAVEIGDALWSALYNYLEKTYPDGQNCYCSSYRIEGVFEEEGQKFAVLQSRSDMKYYRLNFTLTDDAGFVPSETLIEVTKSYTPAEEPQFALEAVEEFETAYANQKKEEEEGKNDEGITNNSEDTSEGENCPNCGKPESECSCEDEDHKCPVCGQSESECTCEKDKCPKCGKTKCECEDKEVKNEYNLDEIVEYTELKAQYEELEAKFNALETECENLKSELEPLKAFKLEAEKKDKQAMIDQFYMLSDEDKADVVANIDTYSIDDIEAKLSIICVRNKVSFDLDENKNSGNPTVYNLNNGAEDDATVPAWIKSLRDTARSM